MKYKLITFGLMVWCSGIHAAVLHTVNFETENMGYTPSTVWTDADSGSASDYFMRAQNGQTSGMYAFSNLQGSYFWAFEDTDNLPSVPYITTTSIDISGYSSFTTTVAFAVDDRGSSVFTPGVDYIDFEYSIDGGAFTPFGSLLVNTPTWQLQKDVNNDGTGDGLAGITSTFSDVSFAFDGSGNQLQIRISTLVGGSDEMGMDNIRIEAVPEPATASLMMGAAGIILFFRRLILNARRR